MKTRKAFSLVLIVAMSMLFTACTENGDNFDSTNVIMQKSFSPVTTTNTIAIVDNQMLYQTLDMGSSTFYIFDLLENTTTEIATISNYVMDSGSAVIIGNAVYFYITESDIEGQLQNTLYRISYSDLSMERLCEDRTCSPLISLYQSPLGILALKTTDSTTYFDLYNESMQIPDVVLEAPQGETFVTATISDDILFVFAYSGNSSMGYNYFIRKYTLDGYEPVGTITLDNIEQYIAQARIAEMVVLDDYLFLNNLSNTGLISSINKDGTVSVFHKMPDIAILSSESESKTALFYVRQSNNYYVFDTNSGDLQLLELNIDSGYLIRSMFADGENVVVKTRPSYENKSDGYSEEIYVYEYSKLTSPP